MKKVDLGRFFDDRRVLIITSVVLAILAWLFVVNAIKDDIPKNFKNIPIEISLEEENILEANNLRIVESLDGTNTVDVTVSGMRMVIGNLENDGRDIRVERDLTGITKPGTYDVKLRGYDRYGKGFDITDIKPSTMRVRVDRMSTRRFTITTDIDGLQIPEDYIGLDSPIVNPKEVEITGPEADINRIDRCVVEAEFEKPLTESTTVRSKIKLYDSEGNEIPTQFLTMSQNKADLTVQVLKKKEVPVNFEFLNVPRGFPVDRLEYTLDRETILLAGPENEIDSYKEIDLGYVNLNEITKGYAQVFDVSLPTGFLNVNNIKSISITFDTDWMEEAFYTVSNITTINVPVNYEVIVNTAQITGINIVGDPKVLATLSASDLVAEIDISEREVMPGPYNLPVRISAPNKGLVWAVGDYSAVVTIREK